MFTNANDCDKYVSRTRRLVTDARELIDASTCDEAPHCATPLTRVSRMADADELICCGLILECEAVPNKDKLKRLTVDVGSGTPLTIVTNASNVDVGKKLVVARVGATLKDGTEVTKAVVGGVSSEGMVCDAPMCGWIGGGAGAAALLPDDYVVGAAKPSTRPRLDGKAPTESVVDDAAAREAAKLKEKEEKKAALAAKRAARDAAKAAKKAEEA